MAINPLQPSGINPNNTTPNLSVGGNNPFLNNAFMPQSVPYGNNGMATNTMPSGSPSWSSFGGGSPSSNGGDSTDYSSAVGDGMTGIGNFLSGMANAQQTANGQNISGASSLMNGINNQEQMNNSASQSVLPYLQPSQTIQPFEQMALANALANAGPPQQIQPGGAVGRYTPSVPTNSNQWQALQGVTNQYDSNSAIENAMAQYNKGLANADPNAPMQNMAAIWGADNGNTPTDATNAAQQDLATNQQASQSRRNNYQNSATQALQQAIANNQGPSTGSKIAGALLGGLGGILGGL